MSLTELMAALDQAPAVKLARKDWPGLRRHFTQTEEHDTGLAGMLRVGKLSGKLVAVEEATPTHLAVRALPSAARARTFVQERLAAYDRMWDG